MNRNYFLNMSYVQRLLILIGVCLISATLFTMLGYGWIQLVYGIDASTMQSPDAFTSGNVNIGAMKVLQSMMSIGAFIVPAFLYAFLYDGSAVSFLGLKAPQDKLSFILVTALMLSLIPFINALGEWNSHMSLPSSLSGVENWMRTQEDYLAQATKVLLEMPDARELWINLFVIGFLPALSEELIFRGVLQRNFCEWFQNKHVAVIMTAFIFSAIHVQFYGFVPRFLLGILLGYLFVWSGSLWLSVLAHFVNNGTAVLLTYLHSQQLITTDPDTVGTGMSDWWIILISISFAIPLILLIYRRTRLSTALSE
jgi:membrane protease YdiL (CAAX protease family)